MAGSSRLTFVCLFLLTVFGASRSDAQGPELGRAFPEPGGVTWLGPAPRALDRPGQTTLVEFWASWSPTSRVLLARQDSLLRASPATHLQILAISHEEPATLRPFLDRAGWTALSVGSDSSRSYWGRTFTAATEPGDGRPGDLPFVFIIGQSGESGPGALLWMGPLAEIRDERPLEQFDAALTTILNGTYDLARAQENIRQEERSYAIFYEISAAKKASDYPRCSALLDELANLRIHPGFRGTIAENMNSIAWSLVELPSPGPEALAAARKALALGEEFGGLKDAGFVDTKAKVARLSGQLDSAIAIERRAVALAADPQTAKELGETLNGYLVEAGLPPEPQAGEAGQPGAGAAWSGVLNDAVALLAKPGAILVRPAVPLDGERGRKWNAEIGSLRREFYRDATVIRADSVSDADLAGHPLLLYGTPQSNPITARILTGCRIALEARGLRVGGRFLAAEKPILLVALPNPFTPTVPAVIYTAFREEDALGLNSVFHGPTALVLGHWVNGSLEEIASLDFAAPAGNEPAAPKLLLAPASLSREHARADLNQLHALLLENYAGMPDLAWDLEREGSSWPRRLEQYLARIDARAEWSWPDFFDLLKDYLSPVQDAHFFLTGKAASADSVLDRQERFVRLWRPFFTGLRLRETPAGAQVVEAPPEQRALIGAVAVDVPVLRSPHDVNQGAAYLFPTIPSVKGTREYLLGCLSWEAIDSARVKVGLIPGGRLGANRGQLVVLPAHRGTVGRSMRNRGFWSVSRDSASGAAVVTLRTMNPGLLEAFPASADSLRPAPGIVLDLRGNGGGSDTPGLQWCSRLSGQSFQWVAYTSPWSASQDPAVTPISMPGRSVESMMPRSASAPPAPYAAPVCILVDKEVASSGETMVLLARQFPGAVLAGENTAGCSSYGNVRKLGPLSSSLIEVYCGRSRFVQDWVRPTAEGVGFFPDYWLDTDDPLPAARELLRR